MRLAIPAMAACSVLAPLCGCSANGRAAHVAVPPMSRQPVMERQILNAVDAGEGNPRVRVLREKVAGEPQNVALRVELAEAYGKAGFPELELEHLRLAVERFPESDTAVTGLARSLTRRGLASEAAMHLRSFLGKQAKPPSTVLSWAGIAEDELGRYAEGEAWHRRAIEGAPGRDWLHNNLGYNLLMQGRKAEAAEWFRKALELNPSSETARNNLGLALADQPDAALAQFRQTAGLAVAHNNLAAYLYEKGDVPGARKELEAAMTYRKDVPQILENLRRMSAEDGQPIRLPAPPNRSFWKSVARGIRQTFVTSEVQRTSGTAEAGR